MNAADDTGPVRRWKVNLSVGASPKRYAVEMIIKDNMPETIMVTVTSTFPERTKSKLALIDLIEFAARSNFGTLIGHFDMDFGEANPAGGTVINVTSLTFSAAALGHLRHLVVQLLDFNLQTMVKYHALISEILNQTSATGRPAVARLVAECRHGPAASPQLGSDGNSQRINPLYLDRVPQFGSGPSDAAELSVESVAADVRTFCSVRGWSIDRCASAGASQHNVKVGMLQLSESRG